MTLAFALFLAFILGYLAQSTGICLVKGVILARSKQPFFLIAILLSGTWAWVALFIADAADIKHHYQVFTWQSTFIIGGFIFGIGSTINGSCSVGTMNQLARGNSNMLFTLCGWALGGIVMLHFNQHWENDFSELSIPYGEPLKPSTLHGISLLALSIIALFWASVSKHKQTILLITLVGLVSECIFLIEPQWTPSNFTIGISYALTFDTIKLPSILRLAIFVFIIIGMMATAIRSDVFELQRPKLTTACSNLLGGLMMGAGGFLAMGGNDKQLLIMLPTFSLSSLATLVSMLLGIYIALLVTGLIKPQHALKPTI